MNLFSIAFLVVGSVCLTLGFIHLLIFFRRKDLKADLFFSLMAFAIGLSSFLELATFQSNTLSSHLALLKQTLFIQLILWPSFAWFIYFYTKSKRKWLPTLITLLYSIALIINFFSSGTILFSEVVELIPFGLSPGETIYYANGPSNPFRMLGDLAWLCLLIYAFFASITLGKDAGIKKALVFGGTIFLCLGLGYLHGTLIDLGIAEPPYLGSFLFLPLSIVMSYSLATEVVSASRLSREVEVAESRWRNLLENVHLTVLAIGDDHKIFYANPYFLELTGYTKEEVLHKPFTEILTEDDVQTISQRMIEVLAKRETIYPERSLAIVTKAGEVRTILWSNVFLGNGDMGGNSLIGVGKDITEHLQAEEDRDQALEELKSLQRILEEENISLKEVILADHGFKEMVGDSNELLYVLNKVQQVCNTDANVLILGETGTGKELVARAIHKEGTRSSKPFIRVNCAAIPADLVESELFGHEVGAFTSAVSQRKGKFELADGGVIFLDEVSEMPLETQAKLLNVLQEREFERVGGSTSIPVDVHVIAATNRNLKTEIKQNRFRADLYFRLNVYPITVPPLRDRKGDIQLLVKHFISIFNKKFGKNILNIPPIMVEKLQQYDWPGNIRELQNYIEKATIVTNTETLYLPNDLIKQKNNEVNGYNVNNEILPLSEMERRHILLALKTTNWQIGGVDGAAHLLQMNPSTLRSRIKKHQLEKP